MYNFGQISSDRFYLKKRILKSQEKHGFVDFLFLCDHAFCPQCQQCIAPSRWRAKKTLNIKKRCLRDSCHAYHYNLITETFEIRFPMFALCYFRVNTIVRLRWIKKFCNIEILSNEKKRKKRARMRRKEKDKKLESERQRWDIKSGTGIFWKMWWESMKNIDAKPIKLAKW